MPESHEQSDDDSNVDWIIDMIKEDAIKIQQLKLQQNASGASERPRASIPMPPERLMEIQSHLREPFTNDEVLDMMQWNAEFREFQSQMIEGDEIWHYSSPREAWDHRCGEAGYALVRDGRAVAFVMQMIN